MQVEYSPFATMVTTEPYTRSCLDADFPLNYVILVRLPCNSEIKTWKRKITPKHVPGYYLALHVGWNRQLFYDLRKTIASSTFVQGGFPNEEQWGPDAIEDIRALPEPTKYAHEGIPHVKMDDP